MSEKPGPHRINKRPWFELVLPFFSSDSFVKLSSEGQGHIISPYGRSYSFMIIRSANKMPE
jgi:hypothetical protein